MACAPSTARATYRCIEPGCGQTFAGDDPARWTHDAEHKPFKALCPDGYTRRYATLEEAHAAGTVPVYLLHDAPAACPDCGGPRSIEVDMTPDAEPFAWCAPCAVGTFKSEEMTP